MPVARKHKVAIVQGATRWLTCACRPGRRWPFPSIWDVLRRPYRPTCAGFKHSGVLRPCGTSTWHGRSNCRRSTAWRRSLGSLGAFTEAGSEARTLVMSAPAPHEATRAEPARRRAASWSKSTSASPCAVLCWACIELRKLRTRAMEFQLPSEVLESLPSLLRYATEKELPQMETDLAVLTPGCFCADVSEGRWMPARHLAYLDRAITESIDQAAKGELEGLVVSMPPQHGKSELCSKYLPAWYLGRYPDRRVILTSYEADFAATWGRKARDLLEHWGHLFGVRVHRRSGAANRWDLDGRDGGMTAAGVGGPITGKGAHLLIVDDPIKNDEEARSNTFREKQWEWWQSVATTRRRPGALIIVIQTRWHRDDLTGRILRQAEETGHKWRIVKFPAWLKNTTFWGDNRARLFGRRCSPNRT